MMCFEIIHHKPWNELRYMTMRVYAYDRAQAIALFGQCCCGSIIDSVKVIRRDNA